MPSRALFPLLPLWARLLQSVVPRWRIAHHEFDRLRSLMEWTEACRRQRPRSWLRASALALATGKAPAAPGPGPVNAWARKHAHRLAERADRARQEANRRYLSTRSAAPDGWLRQLAPDQLRAALSGEDTNRILASAGTGKTRTMVAKAIDLIERGEAAPGEIAFVTFTRNAAGEIRERIASEAGTIAAREMRIGTIHALARELIKAERGHAIRLHDLADEGERIAWLSRKVKETISGNAALIEAVDERRLSAREFKVERARADAPFYPAAGQSGDVLVKSKAESAAALAFWEHRIDYVYEAEYPVPERDRDPERADYRPDFYLPEYRCYVEIWAADACERLPSGWSAEERARYWRDRCWKRDLHRRQGTRLAEASASERMRCLRDGRSFAALLLARVAEAAGTSFAEFAAARRSESEIEAEKDRLWQPYWIGALAGEAAAWMNVVRSRRLSPEDIRRLLDRAGRPTGAEALAALAQPVLAAYLARLHEDRRPDHDETIEWAIRAVEAGKVAIPWRALLVDEYQDTNPAQDRLIHAICECRGPDGLHPRLWAVGDDWQAIYGFQGSDVGMLRRLGRHGACDSTVLRQTWRFGPALAATSRAFVLRDGHAIDKPVRGWDGAWSDPAHSQPIQLLPSTLTGRRKRPGWSGEDGPTGAILRVLQRIADHGGDGRPSVLVVGRTHHAVADTGRSLQEWVDEIHERWRKAPHRIASETGSISLDEAAREEAKRRHRDGIHHGAIRAAAARLGIDVDLDTRTIHGAKGLEADYVVIVDAGASGVARQAGVVALNAALAPLASPDAGGEREERRLWYVAMTRARRKCYIVTPGQDVPRTSFIEELAACSSCTGGPCAVGLDEFADLAAPVVARRVPCPACRNREIRPRGLFAGCSSYGGAAGDCRHRERLCSECDAALVARVGQDEGECTDPQCGWRMPLCDCDPPKPMVKRMNRRDGSWFFGCQDHGRRHGCSKTVNIEP